MTGGESLRGTRHAQQPGSQGQGVRGAGAFLIARGTLAFNGGAATIVPIIAG